ncbi:hypothetical protein JOF56_000357 [Kibdelosporangium banguiense]|uniref:Uncharacterized protein n=1 Tax=Kibdelosporangium banguiense TaxID=1365924 RepID=A0ABS4T6B8_9PSEU|nr:hypothetical protein [Kibdelosporangium banguiense]
MSGEAPKCEPRAEGARRAQRAQALVKTQNDQRWFDRSWHRGGFGGLGPPN